MTTCVQANTDEECQSETASVTVQRCLTVITADVQCLVSHFTFSYIPNVEATIW